ncbi:hypothetical protein ACFL6K_03930 [Candidatus Latescibacterota bacterium]
MIKSFIKKTLFTFACLILIVAQENIIAAQSGPSRYALIISGLAGAPEYSEQYQTFLFKSRQALVDRFMFSPENITVLAGSLSDQEGFIDDISTADNITASITSLAEKVTEIDDVYVFLFGHGSFDGKNAMLNIPRRDLKDSDYAELIDKINARSIVFVNTSSCSAPFISHLSASNRIIITATKSGTERNETVFPEFFVEALSSESADLDKNDVLSFLEIFHYASERTARWYVDSNHLATEHPLMDDNGDNRGYMAMELTENEEGNFASVSYLLDPSRIMGAAISGSDDTVLAGLFEEQVKINREISTLKAEKLNYSEADYMEKLELMLIRLAIITGEIEDRQQILSQ